MILGSPGETAQCFVGSATASRNLGEESLLSVKLHPACECILRCSILIALVTTVSASPYLQQYLSYPHITRSNASDCACVVIQHFAHGKSREDVDSSFLSLCRHSVQPATTTQPLQIHLLTQPSNQLREGDDVIPVVLHRWRGRKRDRHLAGEELDLRPGHTVHQCHPLTF